MDKVAFAHSSFFRHIRECGEDANLDGSLRLCAGGDHQEELALDVSLYTFLQILSVHSFEKIQLFRAFQDADDDNDEGSPYNQLNLFDT